MLRILEEFPTWWTILLTAKAASNIVESVLILLGVEAVSVQKKMERLYLHQAVRAQHRLKELWMS